MLRLQGLMPEELAGDAFASEKLYGDLAGNSFSAQCISAALLALMASFRFDSESECEELETIGSVFGEAMKWT